MSKQPDCAASTIRLLAPDQVAELLARALIIQRQRQGATEIQAAASLEGELGCITE